MTKTINKGYEKTCEVCGKAFTSLSKNQVEWNYYSHIGRCKNKEKK